MTNDEPTKPDGFERKLLISEYEQTSATFRNQGTLLNRSYYLSAIVFTFLVGAIANLLTQGHLYTAAILSIFGFPAFILLGSSAAAYHRRRETANEYRQDLTDEINQYLDDELLRLQPKIAAGTNNTPKRRVEFPIRNLYYGLIAAAVLFLLFGISISLYAYCVLKTPIPIIG